MKIEIEILGDGELMVGVIDNQVVSIKFKSAKAKVTSYSVEQMPVSLPKEKSQYNIKDKKEILGYDKAYSMSVTYDESKMVRNAIRKTEKDYVPTSEAIVKETGLSLRRVQGILHFLMARGVVKISGKHRSRVYRLVVNKSEKGEIL